MIDAFYKLLSSLGYTHPVHPPLTHIPMGLITGAFVFALVGLLFRRSMLPPLAYSRIILLALVFAVPTALLGYTDWQHFYDGEWLFPIKMKLALTGILFILLSVSVILKIRIEAESKRGLAIYALCFLTVVVLGYFGGQLVFEGEGKAPLTVPARVIAGEKAFSTHCEGCHPQGSGVLNAPQLGDFKTFLAFLRNPKGPGGSTIDMPPFPPEKLSDQKAMNIYHYLNRLGARSEK